MLKRSTHQVIHQPTNLNQGSLQPFRSYEVQGALAHQEWKLAASLGRWSVTLSIFDFRATSMYKSDPNHIIFSSDSPSSRAVYKLKSIRNSSRKFIATNNDRAWLCQQERMSIGRAQVTSNSCSACIFVSIIHNYSILAYYVYNIFYLKHRLHTLYIYYTCDTANQQSEKPWPYEKWGPSVTPRPGSTTCRSCIWDVGMVIPGWRSRPSPVGALTFPSFDRSWSA